jgi:hypothetical protein
VLCRHAPLRVISVSAQSGRVAQHVRAARLQPDGGTGRRVGRVDSLAQRAVAGRRGLALAVVLVGGGAHDEHLTLPQKTAGVQRTREHRR